MKTIIITYPTPKTINKLINISKEDYVIAVDHAYLDCVNQNIKVDLVIGDFDSLINYKEVLKDIPFIKLNPVKDFSDTHYAIDYAKDKYSNNQIFLLGGLGGLRFEHTYANMLLLVNNPNLTIINEYSEIKSLKKGTYSLSFKGYINLFSIKKSIITLSGFKYNLTKYKLLPNNPIGLSNELKEKHGKITIHNGNVILIQTKYE